MRLPYWGPFYFRSSGVLTSEVYTVLVYYSIKPQFYNKQCAHKILYNNRDFVHGIMTNYQRSLLLTKIGFFSGSRSYSGERPQYPEKTHLSDLVTKYDLIDAGNRTSAEVLGDQSVNHWSTLTAIVMPLLLHNSCLKNDRTVYAAVPGILLEL